MKGRTDKIGCQRGEILQKGQFITSEKFSMIIMGATKPHNLIGGREGHVEDIYQHDITHNAFCLIG